MSSHNMHKDLVSFHPEGKIAQKVTVRLKTEEMLTIPELAKL